jgi:anaerobic selenocysteine-containing dehydrogenase
MRTIVRGACPLDCPDTCAWQVTVEDGRAVELRGDREHPFTRGALCGKVDHYLDALYSPDRLLHPLRRVGAKGEGRFERISWDAALELVATGFRKAIERHGAESILPYYFAGTMGLIQGSVMAERFFGALGASRLQLTICTGAAKAAMKATLGGHVGFDPEDLVHARLVLLWGANLLSSNLHQWRFVLEARERGAHIVTIDPIRTDTARRSDEHLALRPGTDGALALGLARAVLDAGAADRDWLERYTVGWPELEQRLGEWPVERAAELCELDPAAVRRLGERLAGTRPTAIKMGLGLQRHSGGAGAVRAIAALPAVTGDWRHLGGGVLGMTVGHSPVSSGPASAPPDLPAPAGRQVNMSRLAEALTELDDPPVAALAVFDANPAATAPDQRRVREGLLRDDLFTVVLEQRLTDTTDFADVVLPATMQPEHADLHTAYGHHYVAWNEPALEPPGECLPNSEIFRRLAAAMGLDHPRLRDSDLELARQILDTPACREAGLTLERLREHGWLRAADVERGVPPFAEGGFPTRSGKVELYSEHLAARGHDGLVAYVPPAETADAELAERYPLVLIAPAGRFYVNSTFASLPWHRGKTGPLRVHLHPADAASRGIEAGDRVRVWNDRGEFVAEAVVDDATRPGVAFSLKTQWPKLTEGGANVNATTPVRDTDLGGGPSFHDSRVEVELVAAEALPGEALGVAAPA